jgi:hypothetical protein
MGAPQANASISKARKAIPEASFIFVILNLPYIIGIG